MARKTLIPFGPQHPVFPEPIQLRLVMEDEKVVEALPQIGYVHRGIEKIAEKKDFHQNAILLERICGICSFIHSLSYCQGVEEIMGLQVPDRAKYLRVIWSELHRIHSHLLWLGLLADSFGFENAFMQCWRTREAVLDIMEKTAGARIMLGTCAIGGVKRDISPELLAETLTTLDAMQKDFDGPIANIMADYSVKQRLVGVGKLTAEQAHATGAVGPVLKACGVARDHRTTRYAAYGELDFAPVTATGGDCYARAQVRVAELTQSAQLIRQAIGKLPQGPISVPVKGNPSGETISRTEQPRGEVIYYIKGDGTKNLQRLRVRTPTFANIPALLTMLPGCQLADVPVIVLSIDPCISCTER
jgi:Ni,Fe-hydrogenase III large subunit